MDIKQTITYWLESAAHDLKVAETLFKNEQYDWCLFIGHLVLEKVLKGFYIRDTQTFSIKPVQKSLRKSSFQT